MEHTIAMVCAIIAVILTPVYLIFFGKGTRSLEGIRRALAHPRTPRD